MKSMTAAQFNPMPPFLYDIKDNEVKGTKLITFATTVPDPTATTPIPQSPNNVAQHTIDGKKFDGDVGVVVGLNQIEEWKVVNESYNPPIAHPFHIHINPFQIVSIFAPNGVLADGKTARYVFSDDPNAPLAPGQCRVAPNDQKTWDTCAEPVPPGQRIWWDVFPIPTGKTVTGGDGKPVNIPGYFRMRSRFVDYAGFYVMHCHILAHEDRGMMTVVEVAPLQTPYSHH
jgi:FtsP/CotA-like multicopper oxidase with cupredoxin domain